MSADHEYTFEKLDEHNIEVTYLGVTGNIHVKHPHNIVVWVRSPFLDMERFIKSDIDRAWEVLEQMMDDHVERYLNSHLGPVYAANRVACGLVIDDFLSGEPRPEENDVVAIHNSSASSV